MGQTIGPLDQGDVLTQNKLGEGFGFRILHGVAVFFGSFSAPVVAVKYMKTVQLQIYELAITIVIIFNTLATV